VDRSIRRTVCFSRVEALPRRKLTKEDAEAWAEALTPDLLCRGAVGRLLPWQGMSLYECAENNGGWLGLPVGIGKTLICELLPTVMQSRSAVLILPSALKDKTYEDRAELLGTWRLANPPPRIITLAELANQNNGTLLEDIQPDLLIIDEADGVANLEAGCALKIDEYIEAHPGARTVCMSGTPGRSSIMNYWHHLKWCLRDRAPVPRLASEAKTWAAAIDHQRGSRTQRVRPGVMGRTIAEARTWFAKRLRETPGVVIVDGDSAAHIPISVTIQPVSEDAEIDKHMTKFRRRMVNPAGIPVSDPLSRFRMESQIGSGVYQYYDPPPPEPWAVARRNLARLVRGRTGRKHKGRLLATEAQILRAEAENPIVLQWQRIKDSFVPNIEVEWLSRSVVHYICDWVAALDEPAIIWSGFTEFAEALEKASGLDYYGPRGMTRNGRPLRRADTGKSMIASWHANKRGFNLQPWCRQGIVQPPQSAKWLEQMFGRSHRTGQDRAIEIYLFATSGGTYDGFYTAIDEAKFAKATVGITQKILRADITCIDPRVTPSNKYRWARGVKSST